MHFGSSESCRLLFLPGFVTPVNSYRELLSPIGGPNLGIDVPQLYRVSPRVLLGRYTVQDEARDAVHFLRSQGTSPASDLWLGGHSRGGHSAWLAASALLSQGVPVAGLVLVDPVSNGVLEPLPGGAADTSPGSRSLSSPALVIGAELGGRCAPAKRNHQKFAAASPGSLHVRVADMGHADMLDGRGQRLGRRLCHGGSDPASTRAATTSLIGRYVDGSLSEGGTLPTGVEWV